MSKRKFQPLIVILGPTASGKTSLGLKLAKKFDGEIVSADSKQIYKGLDIGTNKIKTASISIPQHMIDIVQPDQEFTVAQFKTKAIKIIKDILARKKIPFLVGGTGLYISAIVDNLQIPRVPPNKKIRKKIEAEINKYGLDKVYQKLIKLDCKAREIVQKDNPRRVIRALEVCLVTKKPFSAQIKKGKSLFNVLQIGISVPRQKLYKKIDQRTDQMVKKGLINEVKNLSKKYSFDLPSMSGIGYKQIKMYLQNKSDLKETIRLIKRDTRRYARRQMTWFKRDKRICWIKTFEEAEKLVKNFLKGYLLGTRRSRG